jgi:predicted nucleic acid-binding protein
MTQIVAVLDANVLIPETLGSFLATCAYTGAFTPVLSTLTLDEVVRNFPETKNRMSKMETAFAEYMLTPSSQSIGQVTLVSSPEDSHIVAAAQMSKAHVIVTNDLALTREVNNREDFEFSSLSSFEFLLLVAQKNDVEIRDAAELMASLRKRPAQWKPSKVIDSLIDLKQPANLQFIQILREKFSDD